MESRTVPVSKSFRRKRLEELLRWARAELYTLEAALCCGKASLSYGAVSGGEAPSGSEEDAMLAKVFQRALESARFLSESLTQEVEAQAQEGSRIVFGWSALRAQTTPGAAWAEIRREMEAYRSKLEEQTREVMKRESEAREAAADVRRHQAEFQDQVRRWSASHRAEQETHALRQQASAQERRALEQARKDLEALRAELEARDHRLEQDEDHRRHAHDLLERHQARLEKRLKQATQRNQRIQESWRRERRKLWRLRRLGARIRETFFRTQKLRRKEEDQMAQLRHRKNVAFEEVKREQERLHLRERRFEGQVEQARRELGKREKGVEKRGAELKEEAQRASERQKTLQEFFQRAEQELARLQAASEKHRRELASSQKEQVGSPAYWRSALGELHAQARQALTAALEGVRLESPGPGRMRWRKALQSLERLEELAHQFLSST